VRKIFVDEIIEFENKKGEKVVFDGEPYGLVSVEGLGDVEMEFSTQKAPYQDGVTLVGNTFSSRYIPIEFIIRGDNYDEIKNRRKYLNSVLNPKLKPGILRYISGNVKAEIEAVAETVPAYADKNSRGERWQRGLVTFVAPNPYWKSPTIEEEPMAAFVELFEFPSDYWQVGDDGDIYFEMGSEGHIHTFYNNSDVDVPLKITINGPTKNPTLSNLTTGEVLKVNRELGSDDTLYVNTDDDDIQVLLNGQNVFNWIDLSSTFWKLIPGENTVQYTADEGTESATLNIKWQERFVGV